MSHKTILLGLNEINFEFIRAYIKEGHLDNFKNLLSSNALTQTISENEYDLLEPWIQWVTIHTGKSYAEHQVYRLGDIVEKPELTQIFEELESKGKSVGAVSPFNADNRLKKPAFFVPDPWTKTKISGNSSVNKIYQAIHQSVNDNATESISRSTIKALAFGFLKYIPITKWANYFSLVNLRKNPGVKAMILDKYLFDLFIKLWKSSKPDFANLFLNSGAHIQHHYLFNSTEYKGELKNPEWYCPEGWDPLLKVLQIYDKILGELLKIKNLKLIIATGLHQVPHEELTFYWRLKNHAEFLKEIGINTYKEVLPRMSRDFLINFNDEKSAAEAATILNDFESESDKLPIFNVDNRGKSLFIELTYPNDIAAGFKIRNKTTQLSIADFKSYVAFVAIKNGEHNGIGYLTSNINVLDKEEIPLTEVKEIIMKEVMTA